MPSLNWLLSDSVYVADIRRRQYLVINRETGAWAVTNRAGVTALGRASTGKEPALPEQLQNLQRKTFKPQIPEKVVGSPYLNSLFVIYKLTDSCNYRCSYCYDRKAARPKMESQRNAAIRNVLDWALKEENKRVNLLFHGGEPLLEFAEIQALIESYQHFHPHQLQFAIQTNLTYLDQEKLDFLLKYNVGISVSVDGSLPEMNRLRVVGGRDDPYVLLQRKIGGLSGLLPHRMGLLVTVGQHNAELLPQSLLQMQTDGFTSVSFSFMHPVNGSAQTAEPQRLSEMLKQIVELITRGKINRLAVWTLIQWVRQLIYGRTELVCLGSPCGAGRSVLTVLPSGEIGPCDSIFNPKFYSPNLSQYHAALQAGGALEELLARHVKTTEPCKLCDVQAHCNGTCPGNVILENGKLNSVASHECAFHYTWIKDLMWLLSTPGDAERLLEYCNHHIEHRQAEVI